MAGNPLKRGADPYADAAAAGRLLAPGCGVRAITIATGGDSAFPAVIQGRVRKIVVHVTTSTTVADTTLTVRVGGQDVGEIVIPVVAAPAVFVKTFEDNANNAVAEGDAIIVNSDGGATAGAAEVNLFIDPGELLP